jgi:hypothetical protein
MTVQQDPPVEEGQKPPPARGRWALLAGRLRAIFTLAQTGALSGLALVLAVRRTLVDHGVPEGIAIYLSGYTASSVPTRQSPFPPGPAARLMVADVPYYRAWYITNACRRLERTPDDPAAMAKESRYFRLHLNAMSNRLARADEMDRAAADVARPGSRTHRPLLGWRAVMDDRTTAECRAANGKNFYADREPLIGWPGTVHTKCRCRPTAPHPGAAVLPSR